MSSPVFPRALAHWATVLVLLAAAVSPPPAQGEVPTKPALVTQAPRYLRIAPNDPNDHHALGDLARAGLLRRDPKLPRACLAKTASGQKYIRSPAGPVVCAGNTIRLWVGENLYQFLGCQGARCETLETFRPNRYAAVGEQTLGYWSTKLFTAPRIVVWRPVGNPS